jgi:hypothetical protein
VGLGGGAECWLRAEKILADAVDLDAAIRVSGDASGG